MKIATILGTRPEIIKFSPLIPLLDQEFTQVLIHTGQHYSYSMDKIFFEDLNLRSCDYTLNVGSGSHAQQTGEMMIKLEEVLLREKPDLVLVQGDTNSTLAGALTASKLQIKVAHVEAGCRSFDKNMPEEVNRVVVDHLSDFLFAPDENAYENLINEGIPKEKIYLVGNTSVDACLRAKELFNKEKLKDFSLIKESYAVLTIHRQENTSSEKLKEIISSINTISNTVNVLFPVHLRTKAVIESNKINLTENVILTDPMGYKDFMGLLSNSKFVLTDSGGIQEEAVVLNVPCLILRDTTEWMHYVDMGKNLLLGTEQSGIVDSVTELLSDEEKISAMKRVKVNLNEGAPLKIVNTLKKVA
ncbi:non-hydrolyzing UDP-N-acetylglucosamine 2-epimerase [Methanobacterium congolense]|uniref:UDP-N-acetylglucosamine 2-epimerase n=1 Tax=Methanobacterium congolense TaxID=118062 RepID=A0A1D3L2Y3_9EURY|nr:UDP-N-acetylglucosamine 2-epimerase (non-hydrolyzing) [Methanobacterium congolense]SCG86012.1 UDP-N-acetylglucosamine 2-epimerase [Methanobacterium congolense]